MPALPPEVQRELGSIAALGACLLLTMALALAGIEGSAAALRWLPASLACWVLVIWQCRKRLPLNRNTLDDTPYTSLGGANRVTLLRGLLIAAVAGFLTLASTAPDQPVTRYLPAVLYTAAVLGDGLDGYLARRQRRTTRLGEELDTALDALGLVIAPLLAVLYGKLHVSYLLVSVAYYLFQWGIAWRRRWGRPVYPLPPSRMRRLFAGSQMVLVAAVLWPPLPAVLTRPLGLFVMLPLLIGFCIDWLHVSGRRETGQEQAS